MPETNPFLQEEPQVQVNPFMAESSLLEKAGSFFTNEDIPAARMPVRKFKRGPVSDEEADQRVKTVDTTPAYPDGFWSEVGKTYADMVAIPITMPPSWALTAASGIIAKSLTNDDKFAEEIKEDVGRRTSWEPKSQAGKFVMEHLEPIFTVATKLVKEAVKLPARSLPGVSTDPNKPLLSGKLYENSPVEDIAQFGGEAALFGAVGKGVAGARKGVGAGVESVARGAAAKNLEASRGTNIPLQSGAPVQQTGQGFVVAPPPVGGMTGPVVTGGEVQAKPAQLGDVGVKSTLLDAGFVENIVRETLEKKRAEQKKTVAVRQADQTIAKAPEKKAYTEENPFVIEVTPEEKAEFVLPVPEKVAEPGLIVPESYAGARGKAPVEEAPTLSKQNTPFKTQAWAKRAALNADIPVEQIEVVPVEGGFGWRKKAEQTQTPVEPVVPEKSKIDVVADEPVAPVELSKPVPAVRVDGEVFAAKTPDGTNHGLVYDEIPEGKILNSTTVESGWAQPDKRGFRKTPERRGTTEQAIRAREAWEKESARRTMAGKPPGAEESVQMWEEALKDSKSTLYSGVDPTQLPHILRGLKQSTKEAWDTVKAKSPAARAFSEGMEQTGQGMKEAFLDPERVLRNDSKGKEVFKSLANAEESKNAFLEPRVNAFIEATKGVKVGSLESERIGQALDGKLEVSKLSPTERKAYDFMKDEYDFLINEYARRAAGTEEGYQKALRVANSTKDPKEVKQLKKGLSEGEREAVDLLTRKIEDYLPHIFDPAELKEMFTTELSRLKNKLETATKPSAITSYKTRIKQLEDALEQTRQGKLITMKQLPVNIRFRFFEKRKGKEGYSYDAVKAYQAYLYGISRKMFDEPAIRKVKDLYPEVDAKLQPYVAKLVDHYMGWDRNLFDKAAGFVTSLEWMRTLGLNPRSALVNLSQRINTLAFVGEKYAAKAQAMMLTDRAKANTLFEKSGIAREVPHVLTEGPMPKGMELLRSTVGVMFNAVEKGNRKHAYLAGYLKALEQGAKKGLEGKELVAFAEKEGIKTVHKTQFRYGKLGMPKILWNPAGRVALQFSSYTLKQAQFLADLWKTDKVAFAKYLAYTTGVGTTLREVFDTDLSNAIGIGVTWSEALAAVQSLAKGDNKGALRHLKQTVEPGSGLLPSGPGPLISGALNVKDKAAEGKGMEQAKKELTPVIYNRIKQAYDAVKAENKGMYPVKDSKGHVMYRLTGRQLLQRTVGPKTATEAKASRDYEAKKNLEIERKEVLSELTTAILEGDKNTVKKLVKQYEVFPSKESIKNEILNRVLTPKERKKPGKQELYQLQREGQLY